MSPHCLTALLPYRLTHRRVQLLRIERVLFLVDLLLKPLSDLSIGPTQHLLQLIAVISKVPRH